MTLNAFVEHHDLDYQPVYAFRNDAMRFVTNWWRKRANELGAAMPSIDQAEHLFTDSGVETDLLFIDKIDEDPYFVFAGDSIELMAETSIERLRMSELNMPVEDTSYFRNVYQQVATQSAPIGVTGQFKINGEPAQRFISAFFPVAFEARRRIAILAAVRAVH